MASSKVSRIMEGFGSGAWGSFVNLPAASTFIRSVPNWSPDGKSMTVFVDAIRFMFNDEKTDYSFKYSIHKAASSIVNLYHAMKENGGLPDEIDETLKLRQFLNELNGLLTGDHNILIVNLALTPTDGITIVLPHTPNPAFTSKPEDAAPWLPTQKSKKDNE